jgi:hypothetical protein
MEQVSETVLRLHAKVQEILNLEPNWDGYNAPSIHSSAGVQADLFIDTWADKLPGLDIVPCADGSICVTIENDYVYVVFSFYNKQLYSYYFDLPSYDCVEKIEVSGDWQKDNTLNTYLLWLSQILLIADSNHED